MVTHSGYKVLFTEMHAAILSQNLCESAVQNAFTTAWQAVHVDTISLFSPLSADGAVELLGSLDLSLVQHPSGHCVEIVY